MTKTKKVQKYWFISYKGPNDTGTGHTTSKIHPFKWENKYGTGEILSFQEITKQEYLIYKKEFLGGFDEE